MLRDSVAQKPTIAVSDGANTGQNSPSVANCDGASRMGPKPPARATAHASKAPASTSTMGAAQFSNTRTAFIPW